MAYGGASADGVRTPVALGLALDKLFHAVVPKVQCTACGVRRLDITSAGSRLQCPPDGLRVQVDVLQRRVVDMSLTDWLRRVYRKHWNQSALQATYVDLIGSALPYTTAAVNDNLRKIVFLYLKGGIPSARHLANIVLLSFQTHELPRLEEEVRWVCARFGAVIAVDGSSAPLQEARQYRRKQDRDHRRGDPGAALRALGLFDIPLCPTVFVRSEGRAAVAELVAFLVAQATMVDAEALPLGWVQDNTESMWATMVHARSSGRRSAEQYRLFRRKGKLAREDTERVQAQHISALKAVWANTCRLQSRPVVVNALVAARAARLVKTTVQQAQTRLMEEPPMLNYRSKQGSFSLLPDLDAKQCRIEEVFAALEAEHTDLPQEHRYCSKPQSKTKCRRRQASRFLMGLRCSKQTKTARRDTRHQHLGRRPPRRRQSLMPTLILGQTTWNESFPCQPWIRFSKIQKAKQNYDINWSLMNLRTKDQSTPATTWLLPVYHLYKYRRNNTYRNSRCMFVIHNIGYQGKYRLSKFPIDSYLGLPPEAVEYLQGEDNLLEISGRQNRMAGILNGIADEWNPKTDPHIPVNYGLRTFEEGKAACKKDLQRSLGLHEDPGAALIGFCGRLCYQKGVHLITQIIPWLLTYEASGVLGRVQVILMGKGEDTYASQLSNAENHNKGRVCGYVGFDPKIEHRMLAGCDFLLMPSQYEPCGLPQMYAQAYGTVPVVHETGGLKDSVLGLWDEQRDRETATGFLFCGFDENHLKERMYQALEVYHKKQDLFKQIQMNGLRTNYYWPQAIDEYERQIDWTLDNDLAAS
eukprot:g28966.t1